MVDIQEEYAWMLGNSKVNSWMKDITCVEKRKFEKVLISRTCEDVELHGLQEFSENVFSDELTNLVSHKK